MNSVIHDKEILIKRVKYVKPIKILIEEDIALQEVKHFLVCSLPLDEKLGEKSVPWHYEVKEVYYIIFVM